MLDGTFHSLPIAEITVLRDERQRTTIDTEDLQASIAKIGLINPVVVRVDEQGRHVLVAGERRLTACKALQWESIPIHFAHELSPTQASIIELEENIKRKDLTWQDQVRAVVKLHNLYSEDNEKWTQLATANVLSISDSTVSLYMKVYKFLDDERIKKCTTARQAHEVIDRRETRRVEAAFAQLLEGEDPDFDEEAEALFDDGEDLPKPVPMT